VQKRELWKHQQKAVDICADRAHFGLFFDMGTGKTATALHILRQKCVQNRRPLNTLILCPLIVKQNWRNEIEMFAPKLLEYVVILEGTGKQRVKQLAEVALSGKAKIIITNIDTINMQDTWSALCNFHWEALIVDEAHKFKGFNSKRTKKLLRFRNEQKLLMSLILTGTPVLNTPMDLWSEFQIMDPTIFHKNFYAWRSKYFYDANAGMPASKHFPDYKIMPSAVKELNTIVHLHSMRVMKNDVLDLPPFIRQRVTSEMAPEQSQLYKAMKKDFVAYLDTAQGTKASVAELAIVKGLRLQQLVSGVFKDDKGEVTLLETPRTKVLKELLEGIPKDAKIIVWCVFKDNYKQVAAVCKELEIEHLFLTGLQNEREKFSNVDNFNSKRGARVLIANQGAGGVGINLVASTYSIYYSRNFSLEHDLQSEARNYRGGQTKKVTRIDIITPDTIDEHMLNALAKKQNMSEAILQLKDKL